MRPDATGPHAAARSWHSGLLPLTLFAMAVAVNSTLSQLPDFISYLRRHSMMELLPRLLFLLLVYFLAAYFLLLTLRGRRASATHLARRPGRFLLLLTGAACLVGWAAWAMLVSYADEGQTWSDLSLAEFAESWFNVMLWGGLFGWLYILYLQRSEDRMRLAGMLGGRSLLARQLAQSELLAARARIDPAMVAEVLRAVHARYALDAAAGAALLDQLIAYLRLALNRNRGPAAQHDTGAALDTLLAAARATDRQH